MLSQGGGGGEDTQRGVKDGETHLATPFSLQTPQNAGFLISTDAITATQSPQHTLSGPEPPRLPHQTPAPSTLFQPRHQVLLTLPLLLKPVMSCLWPWRPCWSRPHDASPQPLRDTLSLSLGTESIKAPKSQLCVCRSHSQLLQGSYCL